MDQQQETQQPQVVQPEQPKSSGAKVYMIGGIVLICAGIGVYLFTQPSKIAAETSKADDKAVQQEPPKQVKGPLKDGTYTAEGSYVSPAGAESITVTLTLKDEVVTDAVVKSNATAKKSIFMQGMFIDNYTPMVVGKKITEIQLDKVSGSSLTPKGFNDAVAKIEAQASS
jgi:hypothetical protein